jgi:hypothetical protein
MLKETFESHTMLDNSRMHYEYYLVKREELNIAVQGQ